MSKYKKVAVVVLFSFCSTHAGFINWLQDVTARLIRWKKNSHQESSFEFKETEKKGFTLVELVVESPQTKKRKKVTFKKEVRFKRNLVIEIPDRVVIPIHSPKKYSSEDYLTKVNATLTEHDASCVHDLDDPTLKKHLIHGIEYHVQKLKKHKEYFVSLARRCADPDDFVHDTKKSYRDNFARTNIDTREVYAIFGCSPEKAKKMPASLFRKEIDERLARNPDEENSWILRQTRYVLGNDEVKEMYDAYLQGDDALKKLAITDQTTKDYITENFIRYGLRCAELKQLIGAKR